MQRQIKSCTHCRQHKVRCDASKCYPKPCSRCAKFNLVCVVDQNFKPRKGGQVELLREHLAKIQEQIHNISKNSVNVGEGEASASQLHEEAAAMRAQVDAQAPSRARRQTASASNAAAAAAADPIAAAAAVDPATAAATITATSATTAAESTSKEEDEQVGVLKEDSKKRKPSGDEGFIHKELPPKRMKIDGSNHHHEDATKAAAAAAEELDGGVKEIEASVAERMAAGGRLVPIPGPYTLEDLVLEEPKADQLHDYFMENCAPYMPIFESGSAGELNARSEFLFWAVMIVAAQGEPDSELYLKFVGPVKRLAAKKSLLATTRSSSVVQALLVLSTWPLPSEKILEDMSPRYASLAYSMGLQLGIHRGKFIYEFSRNQQLMPNAVKWRSRTWVQTYITQQMVSAASGIPPSMPVDFIIDNALHDDEHPLSPRIAAFLKFAMFYSKLVSIMGTRIGTQDGLMEPESRCPTLDLLKTDLYTMFSSAMKYDDDPVIEIMFLYARCIMDSFAFLPETPLSYQSGFVVDAFQASTRIVTLVRKLVGNRKMIEFPSFIRNPCNYAALMLFRLQSMPHFPEQYVGSARESVVTIHHMYRNISPSWLDSRVSNDISRIAKILESLNHVMMVHPELLRSRRVMRRMRSHLSFSLFYELIYIIHEARRRNAQKKINEAHDSGAELSALKNGIAEKGHGDIDAAAGDNAQQQQQQRGENSSPDSWTADDSPANTGAMHQLINSSENSVRNRDLNPLPLFNNIDRKSYVSSTVVSPNGTTMTKLVPTSNEGSGASTKRHSKQGTPGSHEPEPVMPPRPQQPQSQQPTADNHHHHHHHHNHHHHPPEHSVESTNGFTQGHPVFNDGPGANQSLDPYTAFPQRMAAAGTSLASMDNDMYGEAHDVNFGMQQIFEGIDWMNTEGDDFLGWMLPRNE